jgi:hypothetical protein
VRRVAAAAFTIACMMHAHAARAQDGGARRARAAAAQPGQAPADAPTVDTSHGRIDGDLAAELGFGATFGPRAPRATADLRLRYLWTAGAFVTYEDGPLLGGASEPRRALAAGLELRPLFIARWFNGLESGNAYADLTLDSLGLELGAVFQEPSGERFGSKPGLQAGLGVEIPILPRASGPLVGIHAGARWSDAALGGRPLATPSDRSLYLAITLAWQQVFGAHVVDAGDRR